MCIENGSIVRVGPRFVVPRRRFIQTALGTWIAMQALPAFAQTVPLRRFYVATSGNDGAAGTSAAPWRTIARAVGASLLPGDEIVVGPGTYTEQIWVNRGGNADTASGYVSLRSSVPGGALIRPPSGAYSTLCVRANYVVIDGFDVVGGSGHGIDVESSHHVKVINCIAHDSGGSGIQYNYCEYITIEGNTTKNNAATNGYQCSGISIYQCRNISKDTTTAGFRNIISSNISYGNVERFAGAHTDGNGIIIDDFQSTQTTGYPNYTYPTLVENNLCHSNGGKGIQVTWSDNITVRNNTSWRNNLDAQNSGTWRSELSNNQSSNNKWINNIGVADPAINKYNTAIGNQSYGGYVNQGTVWYNNLTFNGTAGQASTDVTSGNASPTSANGNKLGVDPLFVAAATANFDFRVRSGSPALGAGTSAYGVGTTDLAGAPRVQNVIDIGAYEQDGSGTVTPPPPPPPPPPTGTALSIWNSSATPAVASANDANAVELGVRFQATSAGKIVGVRFYKGPSNGGTHTATLWSSAGAKLASVAFTGESSQGWQEVRFATPVPITAGTTYVASYYAPRGGYAYTSNFFTKAVTSGPLVAPAGSNGVYAYGSGRFPSSTYRSTNYWVDPIFSA